MTDTRSLVEVAGSIIGTAQWIDSLRETDEFQVAQNNAQLEELFRQFSRGVQDFVRLGASATFDQKLQAMFALNYVRNISFLRSAVTRRGEPRYIAHCDPVEMVGEGFENVWQFLIGHNKGGDLYVAIDRLLSLPEVKDLEKFDFHHKESHWHGADRARLWESGEHDMFDWR